MNETDIERRARIALKGQRFLEQLAEEVKTFLKSAVSKEFLK